MVQGGTRIAALAVLSMLVVAGLFTARASASAFTTSGEVEPRTTIRKADGTVLSITCNEAFWTGATIVGGEAESLTTTLDFRGSSTSANCTFAGQTVTVNSGNCDFLFAANGTLHINDDGTQPAASHCKHGKNRSGSKTPSSTAKSKSAPRQSKA